MDIIIKLFKWYIRKKINRKINYVRIYDIDGFEYIIK
jgi:hypothetical protein